MTEGVIKMCKKISLFVFFPLLMFCAFAYGEDEKTQSVPPAIVVVSEITSGMVTPQSEFIGTVYYQEVSDVASEVSGKVEEVNFEEGQRINKGHPLVTLNSDLLAKMVEARVAGYEQVLSDLEKARLDLSRAENLYKEALISEQIYDDRRFSVSNLEKKALSLRSEVEQYKVELAMKTIRAPFDGIIIDRGVDRGEWISPGMAVASLAKDTTLDIIADVPESVIGHVKQGIKVNVIAAGASLEGKVIAVVPKGNISTRTFPVKIRAKNNNSLIEGMEARITLPSGDSVKTFLVPRDAVINSFGNMVVYTVRETEATMVPVEIVGYAGMNVGIKAEGLSEGMKVITKGHERLRPGQPVKVKSEK
jgi:RND family efflux transporter MFP subunit